MSSVEDSAALASANVARLSELYAEYAVGNRAALLGALAEDVVWNSVGGEPLPWAGVRRGRAGVEAYFARLDEEVRVVGYAVEQIVAQGKWVAVLAKARIRSVKSGAEREYEKADFFHMRDGRLVEFREFYDTVAAAAQIAGG